MKELMMAEWRQLTVAVSGSHGLVGSALVDRLTGAGHRVKRLVRRQGQSEDEVGWRPDTGDVDRARLEGVDAVVHLAGEPVLGRWTPQKKARIRDSRVEATHRLAKALAALNDRPAVLVSASAVGYYGNTGDQTADETWAPGSTFLASVAVGWEAATGPAARAGIRVVMPRISLVLTPRGGALKAMLPPFRLGLGGPVGGGRQWMSWLTLEDTVGLIERALVDDRFEGPMNAVTPNPVTNAEFARTLGRVLHRPAVLPAPAWAVKMALGQFAEEGLLASSRCAPMRLEQAGFHWQHPELEPALRAMLGREG